MATDRKILFKIKTMCETVELNYWEWLGKVAEKILFIRLKAADKKDITEDDELLLDAMHKTYWRGEYQLYQSKLELRSESSLQVGLFDSNSCKDSSGTDLAIPPVN